MLLDSQFGQTLMNFQFSHSDDGYDIDVDEILHMQQQYLS